MSNNTGKSLEKDINKNQEVTIDSNIVMDEDMAFVTGGRGLTKKVTDRIKTIKDELQRRSSNVSANHNWSHDEDPNNPWPADDDK